MIFFNENETKQSINGRSAMSHNVPSEQINPELSLEEAKDQVLSPKQQVKAIS